MSRESSCRRRQCNLLSRTADDVNFSVALGVVGYLLVEVYQCLRCNVMRIFLQKNTMQSAIQDSRRRQLLCCSGSFRLPSRRSIPVPTVQCHANLLAVASGKRNSQEEDSQPLSHKITKGEITSQALPSVLAFILHSFERAMVIFHQVCILVLCVIGTGTATSVRGLQGRDCGFGKVNAGRDCLWLDECVLEGELYPCPSENSFCQDRSPSDFGFKCGCLSDAIPVLPIADGSVMLEGQSVPSIDGAPIEFRPLRCHFDTTSNPMTTPTGPSDVPVPGGPTVKGVQCDRNCVNDGEECVESGIANEQGLFPCTCLAGWRKTPGGGCADIKQCDSAVTNNCGLGALCVEIEGGLPGFTCVCPSGFIGGAYTECFDPTATVTVSATVEATLDGVNGIMDETEIAFYEATTKEVLGNVADFEVTSVSVVSQMFVAQQETSVRDRRLQQTGSNTVGTQVNGTSTSSESYPETFEEDLLERLENDGTEVVSICKKTAAVSSYCKSATSGGAAVVSLPTPAPTPAPVPLPVPVPVTSKESEVPYKESEALPEASANYQAAHALAGALFSAEASGKALMEAEGSNPFASALTLAFDRAKVILGIEVRAFVVLPEAEAEQLFITLTTAGGSAEALWKALTEAVTSAEALAVASFEATAETVATSAVAFYEALDAVNVLDAAIGQAVEFATSYCDLITEVATYKSNPALHQAETMFSVSEKIASLFPGFSGMCSGMMGGNPMGGTRDGIIGRIPLDGFGDFMGGNLSPNPDVMCGISIMCGGMIGYKPMGSTGDGMIGGIPMDGFDGMGDVRGLAEDPMDGMGDVMGGDSMGGMSIICDFVMCDVLIPCIVDGMIGGIPMYGMNPVMVIMKGVLEEAQASLSAQYSALVGRLDSSSEDIVCDD
jgi:hypothetical protein